jgi:hypothetical protein
MSAFFQPWRAPTDTLAKVPQPLRTGAAHNNAAANIALDISAPPPD